MLIDGHRIRQSRHYIGQFVAFPVVVHDGIKPVACALWQEERAKALMFGPRRSDFLPRPVFDVQNARRRNPAPVRQPESHALGHALRAIAPFGIKLHDGLHAVEHTVRPGEGARRLARHFRERHVVELSVFSLSEHWHHARKTRRRAPVGHLPRVGPHLVITAANGKFEVKLAVGLPQGVEAQEFALHQRPRIGEKFHPEHTAQRPGLQARRPHHVGLKPKGLTLEIGIVVEVEEHFFAGEIIVESRSGLKPLKETVNGARPLGAEAGMNEEEQSGRRQAGVQHDEREGLTHIKRDFPQIYSFLPIPSRQTTDQFFSRKGKSQLSSKKILCHNNPCHILLAFYNKNLKYSCNITKKKYNFAVCYPRLIGLSLQH